MRKLNKLLAALLLLLLMTAPALAGVPCALPFNLQNGQPADATQVMANYNALVNCLGNAAAAGNNSDITALTGLTTPIGPALGGTQTFVATSTASGSANAITVSNTNPPGFVLTTGFSVVFVAGATNTGATTLQVGSSPATNVFRRTTNGVLPAVGGEIIAGTLMVATYDGNQFQIAGVSQVPIGTILDTIASVADPGFVLMQGQCLTTAGIYNALWTKLGTPGPGSCGPGNFTMFDGRGRVTAGLDSSTTNLSPVCTSTTLGSTCGTQSQTITQGNLPNLNLSSSGLTATSSVSGGTQGGVTSGAFAAGTFNAPLTAATISVSTTISGTIPLGGSGTLFPIVQPTLMVNKQIKY